MTRPHRPQPGQDITTTLTAHIAFDPETRLYVGTVPGLPGAHSQGATLDELQANLREAFELVLDAATEPAGLRRPAADRAGLIGPPAGADLPRGGPRPGTAAAAQDRRRHPARRRRLPGALRD